ALLVSLVSFPTRRSSDLYARDVKGLLRPVGSEPARVYWVRRLVVLAVAVIVLVAAGFFISRVFGSSDESDPKPAVTPTDTEDARSEEHTSELQSRFDLVC